MCRGTCAGQCGRRGAERLEIKKWKLEIAEGRAEARPYTIQVTGTGDGARRRAWGDVEAAAEAFDVLATGDTDRPHHQNMEGR
jgi:hypothetical protein